MKNYLFPPFKDDDEKIEEFNAIRNYLPKKFRHELIMFMAKLESYYDNIISELEADIRHDASVCEEYEEGLREEIKELQAEIKRLNRVNAELSGKLQAVNDSFKAEIKELKAEVDKEKEFAIETSIKNDRLMDQVSSNSGNSSSTHTHTIGKEIAEYIENNDKCKDARLFIVPIEDFDEDECCNKWLTWDEGIE